jgi:hypothetical protein
MNQIFFIGAYNNDNNSDYIENYHFILKVECVNCLDHKVKIKVLDILFESDEFVQWNNTDCLGRWDYNSSKIKNDDEIIFYSNEKDIFDKIHSSNKIINNNNLRELYDLCPTGYKFICIKSLKILQENYIKTSKWLCE